MTDALEMRAISATVGVEEGAVRAVVAGADALCFGHDLADESVESVTVALLRAVESGRIPEERLAEAAARVHDTAVWAASHESPARPAADVGRAAAERAVRIHPFATWLAESPERQGLSGLARGTTVVELATDPSIAAGKGPTAGQRLRELLPDAELTFLREGDPQARRTAIPDKQLVIVAHDAHRHAWQRDAITSMLVDVPDAVVLEVGLPHWQPNGGSVFVATYGSARVNLEAAAGAIRG
jgi:beta-N-acetylhexosaminidase